ncbi:MAG: hypothetical protein ACD_79C00296G0008 [uncultured bacterium]|nr:MAG: hypothetical protein ACD_79C00296G0008 [uncultured bacterium]
MKPLINKIIDNINVYFDKPAFIYYKDNELSITSYKALGLIISGFTEQISGLNLSSDNKVILVGDNCPEWVAAYFAVHIKGLTVVHGDVFFTKEEFQVIEEFISPKLVICNRRFSSFFKNEIPKIYFEDISISNTNDNKINLPVTPLIINQPMSVIFTSGTTSEPKGVMLNETNFLSNLNYFESKKNIIMSEDRITAILPFHHVYPFTCSVLAPFYFGATLILPKSLKGVDILDAIKTHKSTILIAVPKILNLIHDNIFNKIESSNFIVKTFFKISLWKSKILIKFNWNLSKLIFFYIQKKFASLRYISCGGAKLEKNINEDLTLLGFKILEAYGLTETSPLAAINNLSKPIPGSVGKPIDNVSIKIEKETDDAHEGEICIKGANVTSGYYKRSDITALSIKDGWFHTGDLGYFDDKGNLFISGRKKEVIILPNGKNIYPEELEKIFLKSRKISEICITDFHLNNIDYLAAIVVPNIKFFEENSISNVYDEIKFEIENICATLPSFQKITKIEVYAETFPKTALGKIKRFQLKSWVSSKYSGIKEVKKENRKNKDEFLIMIASYLKLEIFPSLNSNFETDLGLDSLSKLELFSFIEQNFKIKIPQEKYSSINTIKDLKVFMDSDMSDIGFEPFVIEEKIKQPLDMPLEKYVYLKNNIFHTFIRFVFHCLCKILAKLFFDAKITGMENISKLNPPFIIAPNHNSLIDGFIIYAVLPFSLINECFFISIPKYFRDSRLKHIRKIARIILTGTSDTSLSSLQYSYSVLKAGKVLCVFPEGQRSLSEIIEDPKKGFGIIAAMSKAPILPVYIEGTIKLFSRINPGYNKTRIKIHVLNPMNAIGDFQQILDNWKLSMKNFQIKLKNDFTKKC